MWENKFITGWDINYGEKHEHLEIKVTRVVKIKSRLDWFYKGKLVLWNKSKKQLQG